MLRQVSGSRLYLPEPAFAWFLIILGVLVIAFGTLAAIKVRSRMWSETGSLLQSLLNVNRDTWNYLLHDYEEPDKWLIALIMALRFPAAIGILWGGAGLAF